MPKESKSYKGWYEIPGYSRYLANEKGFILTKKTTNYTRGGNAGSYLKVKVYPDNATTPRLEHVHILICTAFHGRPNGNYKYVLHADNNKKNNKPSNLSWGSQSENIKQIYVDGIRDSKKTYLNEGTLLKELNNFNSKYDCKPSDYIVQGEASLVLHKIKLFCEEINIVATSKLWESLQKKSLLVESKQISDGDDLIEECAFIPIEDTLIKVHGPDNKVGKTTIKSGITVLTLQEMLSKISVKNTYADKEVIRRIQKVLDATENPHTSNKW